MSVKAILFPDTRLDKVLRVVLEASGGNARSAALLAMLYLQKQIERT